MKNEKLVERQFLKEDFLIEKFAWPTTLRYGTEEALFIGTLKNPKSIDSLPVVRARDGLYSLLWFFHQRPTPGKFKGRLLVHQSLAPYVPKAWRDHAGCYRIDSLPTDSQKITQVNPNNEFELMLLGAITETFCSLKALEDLLKRTKQLLPEPTLARTKKVAFLPLRPTSGDDDRHQTDFILTLGRELGSDIELLTWKTFNTTDKFKKCRVIDLNDLSTCADNFLVHFALSRGASLFFEEKKKKDELLVELSPFHGIYILEKLPALEYDLFSVEELNRSLRYFKIMDETLPRRPQNFFPWPHWFEAWCSAARQHFETSAPTRTAANA